MRKTNLELLQELARDAKTFPSAIIEYNMELPKVDGIKADSIFGVPARYNKMVSTEKRAGIIYKYI